MSAARLLDEVARALAQPMGRGRALRLVGMSVVAVAVPGVRPNVARGASARRVASPRCNPQAEKCCGPDERACGRPGKQWCCNAPSWQFRCGAREGRCVDLCAESPNKFPCTALIAHPESGINGLCCDRDLHDLCMPVGRAATCCYGSPVTCKPMGEAQCRKLGPDPSKERAPNDTRPPAFWAPSEEWKPSCCPAPYGCGGVCCQPPNRCKSGRCQCPSGGVSCDGRTCCPAPKSCRKCVEQTSLVRFEGPDVYGRDVEAGKKCCPNGQICCRTTCCKGNSCCGDKCCPTRTLCARAVSTGKDVCCPTRRVHPHQPSSRFACCPAGTVNTQFGCCSGSEPDCCPARDSAGRVIDCEASGQICVQGQCLNL